MGFINLFLDDYSSGKRHYNRNAGLMLFNPSISFVEDGKFEEVITYFKQRPNFIECVDYGYYIYGVWLIFKYEGLRNLYKKGLFSKFPKAYYIYLDKFELDVCTKNKNWQSTLEKRLGLEDGDLEEVELASKPDIEDFVFDLRKFVKNETV